MMQGDKDQMRKAQQNERRNETEVVLYTAQIATKDRLHEILKEACAFPAYYGGNLSALDDCLGEYDAPLSLTLVLSEPYGNLADYWIRFAQVCMRASFENPFISFRITHEMEDPIHR